MVSVCLSLSREEKKSSGSGSGSGSGASSGSGSGSGSGGGGRGRVLEQQMVCKQLKHNNCVTAESLSTKVRRGYVNNILMIPRTRPANAHNYPPYPF